VTVKLYVPAAAEPLILPVEAFNEAGGIPEETDHTKGAIPPLATLKAWL
jgi:hypothetical protein